MFEGKEVQGKLGDSGAYEVDVKEDLNVEAKASVDHKIGDYLAITGSLGVKLDVLKGIQDLVKDSKSEFLKGAVATLVNLVRPAAAPAPVPAEPQV